MTLENKSPAAEGLEPEGKEGTEELDTKEYVSRDEYDQLMMEATTSKEKAELLDQLLADPEFQKFLDEKEAPPKRAPAPTIPPRAPGKMDIVAQLEKVIEPLRKDMDAMREVYQKDQEKMWAVEAERQLQVMSSNKEDFPFFQEVQKEMADLLESGRAVSMVDAYRLATYDKAKAHGREEVLKKRENKPLLLSPTGPAGEKKTSARGSFQQGKRSLRDIIGDAFDKHKVELSESEDED